MLELSTQGSFVKAHSFEKAFAGDTLNTAVAAARLGSKVGYVTRLGQDPFALDLRGVLVEEGLDLKHVKHVAGFTGVYFVAVQEDGQREFAYYRFGSAASTLSPEDIDVSAISKCQIVYSSGITQGISASARKALLKAFQAARNAGVMTAFDPNYRPGLWRKPGEAFEALHELMPYIDVILPSVPEDTQATIGFGRPEQVVDYFTLHGVKLVVVKMGAAGCLLSYRGNVERVHAMSVDAVDTTGAGDAFNGGFLHGLVNKYSLLDCARLAVTTAGLKVSDHGTLRALPYRDVVYGKVFGI